MAFYKGKVGLKTYPLYSGSVCFNPSEQAAMVEDEQTEVKEIYIPRLKDLDLSGFKKIYLKSGDYTKPAWVSPGGITYENNAMVPQFLSDDNRLTLSFLNLDKSSNQAYTLQTKTDEDPDWSKKVISGANVNRSSYNNRWLIQQRPTLKQIGTTGKYFPNIETNSGYMDFLNSRTSFGNLLDLNFLVGSANAPFVYGFNTITSDNERTAGGFSNLNRRIYKVNEDDEIEEGTYFGYLGGGNLRNTSFDYSGGTISAQEYQISNTLTNMTGATFYIDGWALSSSQAGWLGNNYTGLAFFGRNYSAANYQQGYATTSNFERKEYTDGETYEITETMNRTNSDTSQTMPDKRLFGLIYDDENDQFYVLIYSAIFPQIFNTVNYYENQDRVRVMIAPAVVNEDLTFYYASSVNVFDTINYTIKNTFFNGDMPEPESASINFDDENTEIEGGGDDPYEDIYLDETQGGDGTQDWTKEQPDDGGRGDFSAMYGDYQKIFTEGDFVQLSQYINHTINALQEKNASLINNAFTQGNYYPGIIDNIRSGIISMFRVPYSVNYTGAASFAIGGMGMLDLGKDIDDYTTDRAGSTVTAGLANTIQRYTQTLTTLLPIYGNYLDYEPYTKASLFIPFIGNVSIPINFLYNKALELKWVFCNLNGDFVTSLYAGGEFITSWSGNCAMPMKLTNIDTSGQFTGLISTIAKQGAMIGAGGATAGGMAGKIGADLYKKDPSALSLYGASSLALGAAGLGMGAAAVMSSNPSTGTLAIEGNASTGTHGWLNFQDVVLTVETPKWAIYKDYSKLTGNTTGMTATLRNVHGYTKVGKVQIRCMATDEEKAALAEILKAGVILP